MIDHDAYRAAKSRRSALEAEALIYLEVMLSQGVVDAQWHERVAALLTRSRAAEEAVWAAIER